MTAGLTIPKKAKIEASSQPATVVATNSTSNGTSTVDDSTPTGTKRKRDMEEPPADSPSAQKLQKMNATSNGHGSNGINAVFIEDPTDGAIVIGDD